MAKYMYRVTAEIPQLPSPRAFQSVEVAASKFAVAAYRGLAAILKRREVKGRHLQTIKLEILRQGKI